MKKHRWKNTREAAKKLKHIYQFDCATQAWDLKTDETTECVLCTVPFTITYI